MRPNANHAVLSAIHELKIQIMPKANHCFFELSLAVVIEAVSNFLILLHLENASSNSFSVINLVSLKMFNQYSVS